MKASTRFDDPLRNLRSRLYGLLGRYPSLVPVLFFALVLEAEARLGGGQSYSSGSSSSSSSGSYSGGYSSGGGGGGGGGDAVFFLLRLLIELCIEAPLIGIPLTCFVLWVVFLSPNSLSRQWEEIQEDRRIPRKIQSLTHFYGKKGRPGSQAGAGGPTPIDPNLGDTEALVERIQRTDRNFSRVAFLDFVSSVFHAVHEARGSRNFEPLRPYIEPRFWRSLLNGRAFHEGNSPPDSVEDVVVGSIRILSLKDLGEQVVTVDIQSNLVEVRGGARRSFVLTERWNFLRPSLSVSPPPERTSKLGCPGCGAPVELTPEGNCTFCDQPVGKKPFGWQVSRVQRIQRSLRPELHFAPSPGGPEPGVHLPTPKSPEGLHRFRELEARDPAFSRKSFEGFVREVFLNLQKAWSEADLKGLRPHETDRLFESHRFWVERYRETGVRNQLEEVQIQRVEWVRIEIDAFYEAITLRIQASMIDKVVKLSDGSLLGGNATNPRIFSEYWTFMRSATSPRGKPPEGRTCPSCGAGLEKVNQAGICEYCDSKIVTGDFSWVLAWIEQDEEFRL